jgi:Mg-chelatase subunit ChlD
MLAACAASDTDGRSLSTQRGGEQSPGSPGISFPSDALANDSTPQGSNTGECAGITLAAETQRGPADIIFALDNSGSMDEEAAFVQQNMNAFSDQIVAAPSTRALS